MKVVVTGSSGFIGQHMVRALAARGHEVLGIDIREPQQRPQLFTNQHCDILDRERLITALRTFGAESVVHLAARTDLETSDGLDAYAANVAGTENVVHAIRATPSIRRAIFTSSQLVCRVGYQPKSDDDYQPSTAYGASKVEAERITRRHDGGGATWCIVRPTTVWGPGMNAHYQRFFRMLHRGTYFHVGREPLFKSFGYVGNVVHQYLTMIEAPAEQIHACTFYLGDYEPLALQHWSEELRRAFGAPPIRTIPLWMARAVARMGDAINTAGVRRFPLNSFRLNNVLTQYTFDMASTRAVCGDNPYPLAAAVQETARWFLSQCCEDERRGQPSTPGTAHIIA